MPELQQARSSVPTAAVARQQAIHDRLLECRREYLAYFRRRLGRPEDAEDAYQDFCLKAVRYAGGLQDREKIDGWLGRILRSTLIEHYRRRAVRRRGEDAFKREPRPTAMEAAAEPAQKVCCCVRAALPAIRPDYAEILRRADLDDQPRERIASELSLTANNVGVRLHRARRALKAKISEVCPTCGNGGFKQCDCDAGVAAVAA